MEEVVSQGDTTGDDARAAPTGPGGSVWPLHPVGVVALALLVAAVFFHIVGTRYLIGNFSWWHWVGLIVVLAASARPAILHRVRVVLEAIPAFTGTLAWLLAWFVFLIQLFNVITRYGNRLVERDILFGQTTSMAWQSFGLIFLLGVNYGVKSGVNPRIDFWWANFSQKAKAWLDFVLHIALLLPFIIMAIRILQPYAAISLGRRRDGSWPSGWRVWNTWEESGDADQLAVGPIKAMILVAFILFGLQVLAEIIKTGFVMMGRDDLGDIHAYEHGSPLRVE